MYVRVFIQQPISWRARTSRKQPINERGCYRGRKLITWRACAVQCCDYKRSDVCLHGAGDRPSGQQKKDIIYESRTDSGKS